MSVGQIKTITYLIFAMTRYVSGLPIQAALFKWQPVRRLKADTHQ
jgi:hypothetical protein